VARLVPVFGAFLICLPIVWAEAPGRAVSPTVPGHAVSPDHGKAPANTAEPGLVAAQGSTARDGLYLFAVWAALIGVAAGLAPGLRHTGLPAADDARRTRD